MLYDPDGVFTTLSAFLKFRLLTEHNVLSGAKLVVFEMVLHDVTPTNLEVKEMNVIQFRLRNPV